MFETTISVEQGRGAMMDRLERRLENALKGMSRVSVRGSKGNRAYISLACEEYNREFVCDCLSYIVAEIMVSDFKAEFIKRNARFSTFNEVSYLAFIEALVAFDRESDRELALAEISIEDYNSLDGIYNFKMAELRGRWEEVLALAGENNRYLMRSDTFFELMKFLVGTLEPRVDEVEITIGERNFELASSEECIQSGRLEQLLPTLIDLAPKRIRLHGIDSLSENIKSIYKEIYTDRTVYC